MTVVHLPASIAKPEGVRFGEDPGAEVEQDATPDGVVHS
jgi:hypothetical protein